MLVFLPSYGWLNRLTDRWEKTGLMDKLNDLKHVHFEPRGSKAAGPVLEEYSQSVKTKKGGMLFCIQRGKVCCIQVYHMVDE